jgi:uncharacterized protein
MGLGMADEIHEIPVVFHSGGVPLAGRFFRRATSLAVAGPAVIVTGSWLTVKEQMAELYARRLAALGYAAFTFDFSGFGESGGEPRQAEIPSRKIDDITAAIRFVGQLSFVDRNRIGYLAICASAQYVLAAIGQGAALASFASVAGWYHDAATIAPFYGAETGTGKRLGWAAASAERFLSGGDELTSPAYADGDERAGMYFPLPYYADTARGAIPSWTNAMSDMTWFHWLTFDGMRAAGDFSVPTLMVHGDGCALPDNARMVYDRLAGPKSLAWLEGGQIDFYDRPEQVDQAMDHVSRWFGATLGQAQ